MCDVFDQRDYYGVVNVSYLSASTQVHMKPFMVLAEKIGAMQVSIDTVMVYVLMVLFDRVMNG